MKTQFGILQESNNSPAISTIQATEFLMQETGIGIVRVPIFFNDNYFSRTVDQYLEDGFDVQINFNYKQTTETIAWCKDIDFISQQATKFFEYYLPQITQIPYIAIENEWDNQFYHSGDINDYLTELKTITKIAHKYGFKVSDAGITDGGIKQWFAGKLNITTYLDGIKNININYLNFHWYSSANSPKQYDLHEVATAYQTAAEKKRLTCNEFGLRTISPDLWNSMINGLKTTTKYAIAYSGTNQTNRAITLTADMLQQLNQNNVIL